MFFVDIDGREEEVYVVDVDVHVGVESGRVSRSYSLSDLHEFIKKLEGELLIRSASFKNRVTRFVSSILLNLKEAHFSGLSNLMDEFFISPLSTKIASSRGEVEFIIQEISRNNALVLKWLYSSNSFNTSPFKYILPKEVPDVPYLVSEGYRGIRTKFDDISWFATLYSDLSYFRIPLIVEVFSRSELDSLEKFIERSEVNGKLENPLIVVPYLREKVRFDLYGLMGVKNVYLCISPLSLSVLKLLVHNISEIDKEWFKHIVFGTGFPYSTLRNVTEALLFLLSEEFPGRLKELRWIMGLNSISFLPPKSERKGDVENGEKCVIARENIADILLSSLKNIILHALKKNSISIVACDYLADLNSEKVDLGKCFIGFSSVKRDKFGSMLLLSDSSNGGRSVILLLLRQEIIRKLKGRFVEEIVNQPEIREAISRASILSANNEMEEWIKWFIGHYKEKGLISYSDISSFTVHTFNLDNRVALMNKEDMRLLGLNDGDLIVVRTSLTGDWYIVHVNGGDNVPGGELWVDEKVINSWYVFDGDLIQVEKFEGNIPVLKEISLVIDDTEKLPEAEKVIENVLDGVVAGRDSRLVLMVSEDMPPVATVVKLDPPSSIAGLIKKGETKITVVSKGALTPYNLFLVLDLSEKMTGGSPLPLDPSVIIGVKRMLPTVEEIKEREVSRLVASALVTSYLLVKLAGISRLNKVFFLSCSNEVNMFSILERRQVLPYLEMTPQKQKTMLRILLSYIFDKCKEEKCKGEGAIAEAVSKIKELISALGTNEPALVLFITPEENLEKVVDATRHLKNHNIKTVFISIGSGSPPKDKNQLFVNRVEVDLLDDVVKHMLNIAFSE